MGQQIKLIVLCSFAYIATFFILSRLTPFRKELRDYTIFAIGLVAITAISKSIIITCVFAVFFIYFLLNSKSNAEKVAFFYGVIFVLPLESAIHFNLGFNMGSLNYPKLMSLCVLFPLLFFQPTDRQFSKLNTLDKVVLATFIWQILLTFRADTITSTFRDSFWIVVQYLIPYLAVRYFLRDYFLVFAAIAFALISQMFISSIEGVLSWKMYESLRNLSAFPDFEYSKYKFRHGFLRTEAVFSNPLILSLFANFAFLSAYILYKRQGFTAPKTYKPYFALGAMGITLIGAFMTGSRAGIAGIVVIVLVYHVAIWASRRKKDPKKMAVIGALILIPLGLYWGQDLLQKHFEYRYNVFVVSQEVIKDHFFIGQLQPRDDPRMEVLRQGEGIIDIVNSYVSFALHFGVVGLVLILFAIFGAMFKIYAVIRHVEDERYTLGLFLFCSIVVLSFNLATTSPIGWTYSWIWLLLPICSNMYTQYMLEVRPPRPLPP